MLNYKKYLFLIFLCLLTACFSSHYLWAKESKTSPSEQPENTQEKISQESQPLISLDSPRYNFGEVYEGAEIFHTFTIKNIGTAILNIKEVKAG